MKESINTPALIGQSSWTARNLSVLQSLNPSIRNQRITQSTKHPIKIGIPRFAAKAARLFGFACCRAKGRATHNSNPQEAAASQLPPQASGELLQS